MHGKRSERSNSPFIVLKGGIPYRNERYYAINRRGFPFGEDVTPAYSLVGDRIPPELLGTWPHVPLIKEGGLPPNYKKDMFSEYLAYLYRLMMHIHEEPSEKKTLHNLRDAFALGRILNAVGIASAGSRDAEETEEAYELLAPLRHLVLSDYFFVRGNHPIAHYMAEESRKKIDSAKWHARKSRAGRWGSAFYTENSYAIFGYAERNKMISEETMRKAGEKMDAYPHSKSYKFLSNAAFGSEKNLKEVEEAMNLISGNMKQLRENHVETPLLRAALEVMMVEPPDMKIDKADENEVVLKRPCGFICLNKNGQYMHIETPLPEKNRVKAGIFSGDLHLSYDIIYKLSIEGRGEFVYSG